MKKTDWYPGDLRPVRVGWYEVKNHFVSRRPQKFFWDGYVWRANPIAQYHYSFQKHAWRGLTEPQS